MPFLNQHLETPANLNHKSDLEFARLTKLCADGDGDAMYTLSRWFEMWSQKYGASEFYIRAANYWRYRAYLKKNTEAVKWFTNFFSEHPNEHLDSILYEQNDHMAGWYTYSILGSMLNDLGFDFFDPARKYEIKQFEDEDIVEVSAYESYDGPDEDGFGAEDYYDWWFLDENMQQIPGVKKVNASTREKRYCSEFSDERAKAEQILKQR